MRGEREVGGKRQEKREGDKRRPREQREELWMLRDTGAKCQLRHVNGQAPQPFVLWDLSLMTCLQTPQTFQEGSGWTEQAQGVHRLGRDEGP